MKKPKYKREYYYEDRKVSKLLKKKIPDQQKSKVIREFTSNLVKD